jgi:hypothetical protein
MRRWARAGDPVAVPRWRAALELATEMLPFVEELPLRLGDARDGGSRCDDASRVERVAARGGLIRNGPQVGGDGFHGVGRGAKALQLRVPRVAARATEEHRLREEGLSPEGDEAGSVEMTRMHSPETHG